MKPALRRFLQRIGRWVRRSPAPLPAIASPADTRPVVPATEAGRWTEEQATFQGRAMPYRLYLPPAPLAPLAMPRGTPAPRSLVLMLHGCKQDAQDFATGTRMNALAASRHVVVVYPEQRKSSNSHGCWNWFKPQHQQRGRGEPAMLAALAQSVASAHDVPASRIYVAGLSAGGAMAAILGECYPDVFAAVGVHSGLPRGAADHALGALAAMRRGVRPASGGAGWGVPAIVFHGDADATVHPRNGVAVVEAARGLSLLEPAAPQHETGVSAPGRTHLRVIHAPTAVGARVEHWLLHGGGHAWSGGDAKGSFTDPLGVDASAEMLRFFLDHPHPHPSGA